MQCIELQLVAQHVQSVAEKADPILKKKAGVSLLTENFDGRGTIQWATKGTMPCLFVYRQLCPALFEQCNHPVLGHILFLALHTASYPRLIEIVLKCCLKLTHLQCIE